MKISHVVSILIFSIFVFSVVAFFSYRVSYAYFTDTVVSAGYTFTTASNFNNVGEEGNGSVVINEVASGESSPNEWIELFNTSNESVNLDGWSISDGGGEDVFSGVNDLNAGRYAVVIPESSNLDIATISGTLIIQLDSAVGTRGLRNAGEKVILRDTDENIVDEMSYGDDDSVFSGVDVSASGETLRRIPNGEDNDSADEWHVGAPSIGGENL